MKDNRLENKNHHTDDFYCFFKYITRTKQPLDLYIPIVSDIISIGGPGETRTPVYNPISSAFYMFILL